MKGFEEYEDEMKTQGDASPPVHSDYSDSNEKRDNHKGHSIVATDQSAITGESLAVDKNVTDPLYYTIGCKCGKAFAIVTHSAGTSFVGRTDTLVRNAKDQGHFKAIMDSIGTSILVIVVGRILLAWIAGFYHHLNIAVPKMVYRICFISPSSCLPLACLSACRS